MPIPVNIVIPVDMGSNIVEGSTVNGSQLSDVNRWIAAIDKNGVLVYPRMASAADFGAPAAIDDDRLVSAGLLALSIQQAVAAVGDTHLASVTYDVEQRLLKFVETSGNSWDVVIPISDGAVAGLVKLSKAIDWPTASLDDETAVTPAYVGEALASAMANAHPAVDASTTSTAIPIVWNAAAQTLSIGFNPQNAVDAIVNDATAQAALQAAVDTSLLINDGSQASDPTDATKALSAAGFTTMAGTISAASNAIQQAIVAAVEAWALDKLDFAHFKNAMTIDAPTTIEHDGNDLALIGTGKFGVGVAAPAFRLDVGGTQLSDRKIGINGTQVLYLPDQVDFVGSIGAGPGALASLTHTTGNEGRANVAIGADAANTVTIGTDNTTIGHLSMFNAPANSASQTSIGSLALYGALGSTGTVAAGRSAGQYSNSNYSVFVGHGAGSKCIGDINVCVGYKTVNNTISNTVAVGAGASQSSRQNSGVGVGYDAISRSITNNMTGVGYRAANYSSGNNGAFLGAHAGLWITGDNNTGIGYGAFGQASPVAGVPIAVASVDLPNSNIVLSAAHGVTVGKSALFLVTGTTAPSPIGLNTWAVFQAVDAVTLKYSGMLLSAGADLSLSPNTNPTYSNSSAIGYYSQPSASNEVKLGNAAVTAVRTAGAYYGTAFNTVSDARLKTNLRAIPDDIAIEFSRVVNILDFTRIADRSAVIREAEQRNSSIDFDIMNLKSEIDELLEAFKELNGVSMDEMHEKIKASDGEIAVDAAIQAAFDEYEAKNAEIMAHDSERITLDEKEIVKLYDDTGVIAQEIQKLSEKTGYGAHLVHEDAYGMLTVNTTALMFVIARGFQLRLEKAGI